MESGLKPLGREKFWLWALLTPTFIGLLFGALGSVLATVLLSFAKWDLLTSPTWAGMVNYVNLFRDERLLLSLTNTLKFAALYVPGVVIISLFVAVLLNRKIRGVSLFRTAYFLPAVTSAVATALVWNMIYGKDTGILNFILESLNVKPVCWLCTENAMYSVVIVNIWGAIGEGMIIFLAGLTAIPREYYEASEMDGANGVNQFFRITLPLITPSIFFQTLIATINAFQAYDYIYMLTRRSGGDSSVPVVVFSIYRNAWNFFNYGGASAQAVELTVIVAALMAFYFWLERRYVVYEQDFVMTRSNQKFMLDMISYALILLGAIWMVGPFLWMVSTSFKLPGDQFTKTLIPPTFTLDNFRELFSVDLSFPLLFWNSAYISILITVGQLLTCAMAAFCFAVVKFKGRDLLFTLLLLTLLIPPQVTLIPNFIIFKYLHLLGTSVPLWLPAFWGGAFGTFLLRQYFLTIPRDLVDAARVDGASLIQIFWKIYMPLGRPALAALAIFTFQGAWNDLLHPLVYLPSVPNTTLTVGLAFFQQQMTHGGKFTVLMAGALISILPLLLVFFFAQKQFIEGIALSGVKR